ncbi:hypothetical protein C6P40_005208 [Pichia californica]|uniref:IMS import disulfide relay-system CHCH-CHCH-like Cx9C domain-containing protein n=1 Tax=Pichia californica TaxID=460514 RepID=A0A9P7BHE3_9ASCO|nr:hypothetical protein C6P40_005208 [[Candida] californica]
MASRVLDDYIIQEVARQCPEPFLGFHRCMDDPSITDKSKCANFQHDLQKCVKTQVTVYHRIESKCSKIIDKYQNCLLKDTDGNTTSKCYTELKDLRECAMSVIDTEQKNSTK